ncbi:hypothetical protein [Halobaculum gomorrense]|uniref:FaeA-like protein n=1 Tax=Halobaculum gomorrense TaxID=43928 RepID=A0A1M5MK20_9EURY|nr:hypothetical protein [Halobaculum gomorrense]SHG77555.1 hypothetical protein SAMN05443636_1038 [Halobaculum gomorrense]
MAGRKETVSDEEILQIFLNSGEHIMTTREVSDALGFSLEGTRNRLYPLADQGLLAQKKVGNSPAWWLTDAGREFLAESE